MLLWIFDFESDERYGIGDWFWDPWIRKNNGTLCHFTGFMDND
jgi:hypothetical protein